MAVNKKVSEKTGQEPLRVEGTARFVPAGVLPEAAIDESVRVLVMAWARGDRTKAAAVTHVCLLRDSLRSVAMALGVPKSTVHDWVKSFLRTAAEAAS